MKKLVLALVALFTMTIQASAMSYEQAREQALFLTDKMAYELNLTDDQYEAAYEVNLDYLMSVNGYDDLYGNYWAQRNLDLSYILLDWQYRFYLNASYFYRPLYWDGGYWHFGIYARYPRRDYFYFGRPTFYVSYRGGHSWRMNGGRSWYNGRQFGNLDGGQRRLGMRDGFDRGNYGRGTTMTSQNNRSFGNGSRISNGADQSRTRSFGGNDAQARTRTFGGNVTQTRTNSVDDAGSQERTRTFGSESRQSSTRTTATRPGNTRSFGSSSSSTPSQTFTPNGGNTRSFGGSSSSSTRSMGAPTRSGSSFGGGSSAPSRSFGGGSSAGRSNGGGHFGSRR